MFILYHIYLYIYVALCTKYFLLSNLIYAYQYLCLCVSRQIWLVFPLFLCQWSKASSRTPTPRSTRLSNRHAEDTLQGGLLHPPCCWRAGIGYLCHSVWLQPLGDPYAIYIVTGYLHNAGGEGEKAIREIAWCNQTFPVDNDGRSMTGNVVEVTVNDSERMRRWWPGYVTLHLLIDTRVSVFVTDIPRV